MKILKAYQKQVWDIILRPLDVSNIILEHFVGKSFGRPKNGGNETKMKQNHFYL